jgi:hypothetical protein
MHRRVLQMTSLGKILAMPAEQLQEPVSKRHLPPIPMTWELTTPPQPPFGLPIGVEFTVTPEAIQVHAKLTGTVGELMAKGSDVDCKVHFHRDEILGISMFLMPDGGEEYTDLSWVIIQHRDPFGVMAFFTSTFTSDKGYWPKALAKLLKENMGIEPVVTKEDHKSRKSRLMREGHEF